MFVRKVCAYVLCAGLVLSCATVAEASLKLRLTDSAGGTITITDNMANDFSPIAGNLTFAGSVGTFDLVVEIGTSKPVSGSAAFPLMTLTSSITTTGILHTGLSTLTIELTDTDFGPSLNPLGFLTAISSSNATTQSSTLDTYIDLGNAEFAATTLLSSLGPSVGMFDLTDFASAATDPAYSLTMVATVTHAKGAGLSNWDASISAIPEPVAFVVWSGLMGLAGLVAYRRRANRC